MADENVEIAQNEKAVQAIVDSALEHERHDNDCSRKYPCWDNRYHLAALVMHRLELELSDLGFIAEALIEVQCEEGDAPTTSAPEAEAFGPDDILNVE